MNNPRNEIAAAVKALTLAPTPAVQRAAINKYFAPEAGFLHPLCTVHPGPGSREEIVGIYEWYRDMSPKVSLEVESFVYDETQKVAYLNVVQNFHIFLSPFASSPARLLVKVSLRKNPQDGKYYIIQQEDYYQPEDIFRLVLPFLATPIVFVKRLAGRVCGVNAAAFALTRDTIHQGMALLGFNAREGRMGNAVHQE
ncbi:uncharacterized protein FOMMEDRAFT_22132 [Fomitiporia mediterranea MF3/22]|uniref:uncharacterized protein n=1 Tax=Fomitiporia mediterranea (strain MF3/22) TaxID=694068 RepID=UPI0004407AD8|nr:uncharacterized protein FOMMEDRAFT_22132 [Fomitiporia mediterranea MF3/22]EJD00291.1 hypothetical protein FOMMEDRAFT_22132 [Fomitiporia mediterranea MF3/22]